MAVVVTEDCRPYYNYGLHELTKGTVIPAGEFADYLLTTGAPVEVVSGDQAAAAGSKAARTKRAGS